MSKKLKNIERQIKELQKEKAVLSKKDWQDNKWAKKAVEYINKIDNLSLSPDVIVLWSNLRASIIPETIDEDDVIYISIRELGEEGVEFDLSTLSKKDYDIIKNCLKAYKLIQIKDINV